MQKHRGGDEDGAVYPMDPHLLTYLPYAIAQSIFLIHETFIAHHHALEDVALLVKLFATTYLPTYVGSSLHREHA